MANKKKKQVKPRFYVITAMFLAWVTFMIVDNLDFNMFSKDNTTNISGNYVLFNADKSFVIFENKFIINIPNDIYLEKGKPFEEYIKKKNYNIALQSLNTILPESINKYILGEEKDIPEGMKIVQMPVIDIKGLKYPDTYELTELFVKDFYEIDTKKNKDILIDVLNANGIAGDAGRTGKALKEKYGYKYSAANHETKTNYSYIINKNLTRKKMEEIVMTMNQKNIKIKKDSSISTIADAIIILGQENVHIEIVLKGNSKVPVEQSNKLYDLGYKNIRRFETSADFTNEVVYYEEVNYYTAYKISKYLGIDNMKLKEDLNNSIEIYILN